MTIYNVFTLFGGLAMFLFGMKIMGEALEKRAGTRLKKILENLTNNPIKGVLLGAAVTAAIQSSSATTVMAVGFVNSGIMELRQAISVVMGANIGTTITAWLLSLIGIETTNFWISLLKPTTFSPILAFVGIIMLFTSKKKKDTATIFLGFAVLMIGMDMMSGSVRGLSQVPEFVRLMVVFSNPVLGVLVGAGITAIIQASAASIGMLQALANTGIVTFGTAIPIVLGQNIGTCITAILSSIGTNKNAKRVAAFHLAFNIIGTVFFLSLFYALNAIIRFSFLSMPITAWWIAIVHTLFNMLSTIVLFPFIGKLERLVHVLVREGKSEEEFEMLDDRLLGTPSIAIEQCRKLTNEMASLSRDALLLSLDQLREYNEKQGETVLGMESKVDVYEDKLGSYLVKVCMQNLTQKDSREASKILHVIGNFERVSDHAVNLVEAAQEMHDKDISFSDAAQSEIAVLADAVTEILNIAIGAFVENDLHLAVQVEPLEQVVDTLCTEIKARHIRRLQAGLCTIELGFILSDVLANLERVADHCSNIAISIIEMEEHGLLDAHDYLKRIKSGQGDKTFNAFYESFSKKYSIVS